MSAHTEGYDIARNDALGQHRRRDLVASSLAEPFLVFATKPDEELRELTNGGLHSKISHNYLRYGRNLAANCGASQKLLR